jgi:hypothetical protein
MMSAGPGGTFWVAWGAIAYGIFQLVSGLIDARKPRAQLQVEEKLEREFQTAVLLEARGDILFARAIYEDLARNYPDTRVGRNAKNTIQSMPAHRPELN